MIITEVDKKKSFFSIPFKKKKISMPEEISDQDISENEFIETVLDHCKYSRVKNIKNQDLKKRISFKKFATCKIKYINAKKVDDITLEKFAELEKKNKDQIKKNVDKKKEQDKKESISKKIKKENVDNENIRVSFRWQKFPYPIISSLKMRNKTTGILNFYIHETEDECVGTIALNSNNKGNWSLSCPDNKKRSGVFKKSLGASGSIVVENSIIIGTGYDNYRNEVKFIAK